MNQIQTWPSKRVIFVVDCLFLKTNSHVSFEFHVSSPLPSTIMDGDAPNLDDQDESVRIAVRALGDMRNNAQQGRSDRKYSCYRDQRLFNGIGHSYTYFNARGKFAFCLSSVASTTCKHCTSCL